MNYKPFLFPKRTTAFFIIALCGSLMAAEGVSAQLRDEMNLPDHDLKKFYLGIGFMYNNSHFQVSAHPQFLASDSVLSVNPLNTGGFGVSGMFTYRISEHFEARFAFPEFQYSYKSLEYHVTYPPAGEQTVALKRIESLLLGFPTQVKFLSDRIDNFRVYMLGGFNYQYDLASNASARKAENLVKLTPTDFSIEVGVGFQFYFPVFILSPELKFSEGIKNIHSRDPNLQYSNVIDKLESRMVVFSLIFEG